MKTRMMTAIVLVAMFITAGSFTFFQVTKPWVAPDKYSKMNNPVKADAASASTGKEIWGKQCQSCHGKSGKGDGTKAKGLKTFPGDFSGATVQNEKDGSLFYKISEGRDEMPGFKKKLPDAEEIWSVVNYMRTFKQ